MTLPEFILVSFEQNETSKKNHASYVYLYALLVSLSIGFIPTISFAQIENLAGDRYYCHDSYYKGDKISVNSVIRITISNNQK